MGRRGGGLPSIRSPLKRLLRPPGRQVNQALLVILLLTFGTGVAAVAIGSPNQSWVAIGHGICGMAVVLLIPWKSRVARAGLRRARFSRWLSLLLAALALVTLIAGLGYAVGWVRSFAGETGLWLHIAVALALVPLVAWHIWARGIRPRRTDLSRRTLLRAGGLATGALALYVASETAFRVLGLPGARRRFTGSYETASFRPEAQRGPGPVAAGRQRRAGPPGADAGTSGNARHPGEGHAGLHIRLVFAAGLDRRAAGHVDSP